MDLRVKLDDETHEISAVPLDSRGRTAVDIAGEQASLSVTIVSPNHLHLEVDGRGTDIFTARSPEGTWIWSRGRARLLQDADKAARRGGNGPVGRIPDKVTPPTPATVVRLMAEVGQQVEAGQPLVVVSAMKMETTLSAPYAGTVTAVNTQPEARVNPGEILVEIEPAATGGDEEES